MSLSEKDPTSTPPATAHGEQQQHDDDIDPEFEEKLPAQRADAIRSGSLPEHILKHSHDADEALKAFASHSRAGHVITIDEATNKRLLRKIDMNLMPVRSHL